jgi:hypothetical protein
MKMPAAMASRPMIIPRPLKLKLNNAISPYRISQIASKSMPIFFVNLLMVVTLSLLPIEQILITAFA